MFHRGQEVPDFDWLNPNVYQINGSSVYDSYILCMNL